MIKIQRSEFLSALLGNYLCYIRESVCLSLLAIRRANFHQNLVTGLVPAQRSVRKHVEVPQLGPVYLEKRIVVFDLL